MNTLENSFFDRWKIILIGIAIIPIISTGCHPSKKQTSVSNKQVFQDSTLVVTLANPADSNQISVLVNDAAATRLSVNEDQMKLRVPVNDVISSKHGTVQVAVKLNGQVLSVVDLPYVLKPTQAAVPQNIQGENSKPLDLLKLAPEAEWHSAVLQSDSVTIASDQQLKWPGQVTDYQGFALEGTYLTEDGSKQFLLWTHPRWVDEGCIYGSFQIKGFTGRKSFSAILGFVSDYSTNSKSTDGVTFQVWVKYTVNGREMKKMIFSQHKNQDGSLLKMQPVPLPEDVPGDFIFELHVNAGKQSLTDWAAWINPELRKL